MPTGSLSPAGNQGDAVVPGNFSSRTASSIQPTPLGIQSIFATFQHIISQRICKQSLGLRGGAGGLLGAHTGISRQVSPRSALWTNQRSCPRRCVRASDCAVLTPDACDSTGAGDTGTVYARLWPRHRREIHAHVDEMLPNEFDIAH